MNGIENIIKRIDKDTETKAADIISRARVDAAEIAKEYEEKCKEIEAAGKERAEKAAQERLARICGANDLEARKKNQTSSNLL